jgi:hypothetical protein
VDERELRDLLADQIDLIAEGTRSMALDLGVPLTPRILGTINGLRMAACLVRDNHPKEEVSNGDHIQP